MNKTETILQCSGIKKLFYDPVPLEVLKGIDISINKSEFISIVGPSGCGKSTLLYILSTMDTTYTGELFIEGQRITGLQEQSLATLRNEKIGFVFQFHYLINEFTVLQNVMLPALKLKKYTEAEIEIRAMSKLDMVGVGHLAKKRAALLSGGEKQRVAVARALINDPAIIMGDEPTGNLDKKNADLVFQIFKQLAAAGQTLLIVTHSEAFANGCSRIIEMDDGRIK